MEQHLEKVESEVKQSIKKQLKKLVVPACLAMMFILICVITFLLLRERDHAIKLENSLSKMKSDLSSLDLKIDTVDKKITPTDGESDLKDQLTALQNNVYVMNVQHRMENGVITDDFVVEKATIIALPSPKEGEKGFLSMSIDLSAQPNLNTLYKGQGTFSIPDRELKSKLMDVINELSESYTSKYHTDMPAFDDGSVHFTFKNYDLATYENRTLKLKGE